MIPVPKKKKCSKCKRVRASKYFYPRKDKANGLTPMCKDCWSIYLKERRISNPTEAQRQNTNHKKWLKDNKERVKKTAQTYYDKWKSTDSAKHAARKSALKCKYGLSFDEYIEKLNKQENRCAICGKELKLICVDYCHKTMLVRGLLCQQCNLAIGLLGDDSLVVERAARYLRKYETKQEA